MREKLFDLELAAAAATNSGLVMNSADILRDTRESIEALLAKPLLPE